MRGLLIKDMRLLLGQKRFILIVFGMGLMLMFSSEQPSTATGYMIMLITIFSLNTISYDEHENGMSFLMTLPASRKTYVQEKFVFAGILAFGSCALAIVAAYFISMAKKLEVDFVELFVVGGVVMAVGLLVFGITLPLQIKFGSEKGRIAMFGVFAVVGVVVGVLAKLSEGAGEEWEMLITAFSKIPAGTLIFGAVFALIIVLLACYLVSVKIISKKEY